MRGLMADSIGIITNETLLIFNASFDESRTVLLKRAALLYDKILIPTPQGLAGLKRSDRRAAMPRPSSTKPSPLSWLPILQTTSRPETDAMTPRTCLLLSAFLCASVAVASETAIVTRVPAGSMAVNAIRHANALALLHDRTIVREIRR